MPVEDLAQSLRRPGTGDYPVVKGEPDFDAFYRDLCKECGQWQNC